jgi:hypothetical protein
MDGKTMMATKTARTQIHFVKRSTADGSYWTSGLGTPTAQLVSYVRGLSRTGTKFASIGGEQEQGFEQAFSSLAYAYLKDKAPRLIDYIVGFQLVDRNEDNTKAVGVFGFKVGKQWLYAPVFFLNGDLKGHELLYIKQQDSFVPMKENWVNYIMSRKPHVLGEGSPKDVYQLGGMSPNIERMSYPPPQSKYGSARIDEWAMPVMPLVAALATKQANFLWAAAPAGSKLDIAKIASSPFKAALADVNLSLESFLAEDVSLAEGAYELARKYPGLKVAFDKIHGADFFKRIGQRLKSAAQADVDNVMPPEPKPKSFREQAIERQQQKMAAIHGSVIPEEKTAQSSEADKKPKVTILTDPDVAVTKNKNLDEGDKKKLLRHGYLVKDERKGDEISQAYNTQVRIELSNPHETGLYEVLEKPGSFERMLVISNPQSNGGGEDFVTVVRLGDGEKKWLNGHRTAIFARKVELDEDYRDWFSELGDKSSLTKGGTYIAISERGEGTVPFQVSKSYEDGSYKVDFNNSQDWKAGRSSNLPLTDYGGKEYVSPYDAMIMFNDRPGTKLKALAGVLHIPDNFKFLKLKDPPKPKKNDENDGCELNCCKSVDPVGWDTDGSETKPIVPGDISDIQLLFSEKTSSMKIWGDHSEVVIQTEKMGRQRLPWRQGMFSLIRDHGFDEKTASEMLRQAQVKSDGVKAIPVQFRVKYAGYYPSGDLQSGGPYAPPMPSPNYGSESVGYNSVNAIYPQTEHMPVPGLDSSQTDPRIYDPFLMPDQDAVSTAQQAGQQGQKEVFDTAMVSGMLKAVRQDSLVDRYLGDLMKATDKLGRLLFMFYWHQEEFAERYGKNALPELEDSLRNSFEAIGDVVLFLKEKTVEPGLDEIQDPSIDEMAKN